MVRNGVVECAEPYGQQLVGFRGLVCSTRDGDRPSHRAAAPAVWRRAAFFSGERAASITCQVELLKLQSLVVCHFLEI